MEMYDIDAASEQSLATDQPCGVHVTLTGKWTEAESKAVQKLWGGWGA